MASPPSISFKLTSRSSPSGHFTLHRAPRVDNVPETTPVERPQLGNVKGRSGSGLVIRVPELIARKRSLISAAPKRPIGSAHSRPTTVVRRFASSTAARFETTVIPTKRWAAYWQERAARNMSLRLYNRSFSGVVQSPENYVRRRKQQFRLHRGALRFKPGCLLSIPRLEYSKGATRNLREGRPPYSEVMGSRLILTDEE